MKKVKDTRGGTHLLHQMLRPKAPHEQDPAQLVAEGLEVVGGAEVAAGPFSGAPPFSGLVLGQQLTEEGTGPSSPDGSTRTARQPLRRLKAK